MLERAGYRVARRRRCCNKIGHQHKLTKEDVMAWFQRSFEVRAGWMEGVALPRWAGQPPSSRDAHPRACWCSDFTARIAGDYPQQASPVKTYAKGLAFGSMRSRRRTRAPDGSDALFIRSVHLTTGSNTLSSVASAVLAQRDARAGR